MDILTIDKQIVDDKVILSIEDDISMEIKDDNEVILVADDKNFTDLIDMQLFNEDLNVNQQKLKIYEKKSKWEIEIPMQKLKQFLYDYFYKKTIQRNLKTKRQIQKKTNQIFNLIQDINNDKKKFKNPINFKNKEVEKIVSQQTIHLDWIYPITDETKKLYSYSTDTVKEYDREDKIKINESQTKCIMKNAYSIKNKSLINFIKEYLNQEQLEDDELAENLSIILYILKHIVNYLHNENLLYKQDLTIDSIDIDSFGYADNYKQKFNNYIKLFSDIIENKDLYLLNDYKVINHHNEIENDAILKHQLYNQSISFNNKIDNTNTKSYFDNLYYNGGLCVDDEDNEEEVIPVKRNYFLKKNDFNNIKQYDNNQNIVRGSSLIDHSYKMNPDMKKSDLRTPVKIKKQVLMRKTDGNEYYYQNDVCNSSKRNNAKVCGNKKQLRLYIDPDYNNDENIVFIKNERAIPFDWKTLRGPPLKKLNIEAEKVNLIGYYIDNQKLNNYTLKTDKLIIDYLNDRNFIIHNGYNDGFNLKDLIFNKLKHNQLYENTIHDEANNYNKYLNHVVMINDLKSLEDEMQKEKYESNKSILYNRLEKHILSNVLPNLKEIRKHIDFKNVENISDINRLLFPYNLSFNDLIIKDVTEIQHYIHFNIHKIKKLNKTNQQLFIKNQYNVTLIHNTIQELNNLLLKSDHDSENKKSLVSQYLTISLQDNLELYKLLLSKLKVIDFNKSLLYNEIVNEYTKQCCEDVLMKHVKNLEINNHQIKLNDITYNKHKFLSNLYKIEIEEESKQILFIKNLIVNYFCYQSQSHYLFKEDDIDEYYFKNVMKIYDINNNNFFKNIKNTIDHNLSNTEILNIYIESKAHTLDNKYIYNFLKEYKFKEHESKSLKSLIDNLIIHKINKCKNTKFKSINQIEDYNDSSDDNISLSSYQDSIQKYDLKSYKKIIKNVYELIKKSIYNYNNYGINLNFVKQYNSQEEINEFNSKRSLKKQVVKDKDNQRKLLLDILINISQLYIPHKIKDLKQVYQFNKENIIKDFLHVLNNDEIDIQNKIKSTDKFIEELLNDSDEFVKENDYCLLKKQEAEGYIHELYQYKRSANNFVWKQVEVFQPADKIDFNADLDKKLIQAGYINEIMELLKDMQNLDKDVSFTFSEYRLNSIINYIKKHHQNKIKNYLIKLFKFLFGMITKYSKVNRLLSSVFDLTKSKQELDLIIKQQILVNNIKNIKNQSVKLENIEELDEEEDVNELKEYLDSILFKLNENLKDKNQIELLKNFIDRFGFLDKLNNNVYWLNSDAAEEDREVMLCYHYYYLTDVLNLKSSKQINFYKKFIGEFGANIDTKTGDENIYCKHCGEKLSLVNMNNDRKFMDNKGTEIVIDEINFENINDTEEWRKERLNPFETSILSYVTNFTNRLGLRLRKKDILDIINNVYKLKYSKLFNIDFILSNKHHKIDSINLEDFKEYLNQIFYDNEPDYTIILNRCNELISNKNESSSKEDLESRATEIMSQFGTGKDDDSKQKKKKKRDKKSKSKKSKKAKKSKKSKFKFLDRIEKERDEKYDKIIQEKRLHKLKRGQYKKFKQIIEKNISDFNIIVKEKNLFIIIASIFIKLQVSIPDYKNINLGSERQASMSHLITDYYQDSLNLVELFTNLLYKNKQFINKGETGFDIALRKLTKKQIKQKLNDSINKLKFNYNTEYDAKKLYRRNKKVFYPTKKWNNFKPIVKRNESKNKLIKQIYEIISQETLINREFNHINFVNMSKIDTLMKHNSYLQNFHNENKLIDIFKKEKKDIKTTSNNTIFPDKKDELYLHIPTSYMNKIDKSMDNLTNMIKELILNYSFQIQINEKIKISPQLEKRYFIELFDEIIEEPENKPEEGEYADEEPEKSQEVIIKHEIRIVDIVTNQTKKEIEQRADFIINEILSLKTKQEDKINVLLAFYKQLISEINKSNSVIKTEYTIHRNSELLNYIDEINSFEMNAIRELINRNSEDLMEYKNYIKKNEDTIEFFNKINDKNNKFYEEGIKNSKIRLTILNINESDKLYEIKMNRFKKMLKTELLNKESDYIVKFIKIFLYKITLIHNKFNKIKQLSGVEKEELDIWYDTTNTTNKKIMGDYSSISKENFNIIKDLIQNNYETYYNQIGELNYVNLYNELKDIYDNKIIKNCLSILELLKIINKKEEHYNTIIKLLLIYLINTLKDNVNENVFDILYKSIKLNILNHINNIDLVTDTEVEDKLFEDKGKQNQRRKQNFDNKNDSQKNIYNLRRQFNLGNIENDLEAEIVEVENLMNETYEQELVQVETEIAQEYNPNNIMGNINVYDGEDNNEEIDIFD